MKPFRAPGWLTGVAIAAVAAVNLAGVWGIAMARQGAIGEAVRTFSVDVTARASTLESRLSEVRADLAFLGGSPTIARLDDAEHTPEEASILKQAAESALLLFLRSNAEVVRIVVRSADSRPLVHVGRRGGVPLLWVSVSPTGEEGAAVDPTRPRLTAILPHGQEAGLAGGVTIETEVDPSALIDATAPSPDQPRYCMLSDATGALLARRRVPPRPPGTPAEREVRADAPVRAEGWSLPGPLVLDCAQPEGTVVALAEPVWARYRTTLALNAGVMGLALLLGGFAVQQARRCLLYTSDAADDLA